jgi:hypothetical protein
MINKYIKELWISLKPSYLIVDDNIDVVTDFEDLSFDLSFYFYMGNYDEEFVDYFNC